GDDARAGGQDQVVVAERQAVCQRDDLAHLVHFGDLTHDERHPLVEEGTLRALEVGSPFAAHRDVHEARLVDVLAGRIDDQHLDLPPGDPGAQLLDEEVGGQGAPDTSTEDEDPLHGRYRTFSTTISSYPSRVSSATTRQ